MPLTLNFLYKYDDCGKLATRVYSIIMHRCSLSEFIHTGRAKKHHSDLGGNRTRDLWITKYLFDALTTEPQGLDGSSSDISEPYAGSFHTILF